MFWPICLPAFFRCLSNSETFTELRTMSFIESMGVASSESVSQRIVRTYWLKHYGNNNKDEDNSPKTLNDKNHQTSSQKFRQLILNCPFNSRPFWLNITFQLIITSLLVFIIAIEKSHSYSKFYEKLISSLCPWSPVCGA